MLGCHPSGKTRTQLLQELHSGIEREFSDYVQERVIDPGHRIEALWRPIAEDVIGDDLHVLACTLDVGLSRPLGASLDAITFMDDVLGECKTVNDALRAALPHAGRDSHKRNDARNLPKGYRVQMEQQQLVSGAARTLFSACSFNADGTVAEERHCWYESDPALRAEIVAGWRQFDADLAAYVPQAAAPVLVAEPVQALPAVSVQVTGELVLRDNFKVFESALRDFLEHRLIRAPKTDQDFADLDVQIKAMKGAEAALESAEAQMLAQIETVDQAKRTKDMLAKLVRENRLMAEKLLASEKERRRGEIVTGGAAALAAHVAALNTRLGKPYMPFVPADFGGCIKGMKSLASMEDKVGTELARAKIAANEIADRIDTNLKHLREHAGEYRTLFPDVQALVQRTPEDCALILQARITEHKAAEERRLEAERERIRAEEQAKLAREQEAAARAPAPAATHAPAVAPPAANVLPMPTKGPAVPTAPALRLGQINERLSPLSIDAAGLAFLGFPPVGKEGAAKLYHEADFPRICAALVAHIEARQQRLAA